nr:PD-(D/E)XK nuclease family protein [Ramlibacter sp.]
VQAGMTPPAPPLHLPVVPAAPNRPPAARPVPAKAASTPDSLFGEALHRLLEIRLTGDAGWRQAQLLRVGREFNLAAPTVHHAAAMAQRILTGEGAWAWDERAVDWQANEVELVYQGELLRLDRLVRRGGTGDWWVLDFKSASRPERDPDLLAQMQRYRLAVQAAHPGTAVQAAFLTGQGRLVVVP